MKHVYRCLAVVLTISMGICSPVSAGTVLDSGSSAVQATISGSANLNVTILLLNETTSAPPITFNNGNPIDQTTADAWLQSDKMIHVAYDCNEAMWAVRMVTNNVQQFPGITHRLSADGSTFFTSGLIKAADDEFNRPFVAFQVLNSPSARSPLDDDHVFGVDANSDGDFDDPGDVAREWGLISDKGDANYVGWDANGDSDYTDVTGLDSNSDGDYLDDGEYPPDVAPEPDSAAFWIVYGQGAMSWIMDYAPGDPGAGDGDVYVYLGSNLGDTYAAGSYATTIHIELFNM